MIFFFLTISMMIIMTDNSILLLLFLLIISLLNSYMLIKVQSFWVSILIILGVVGGVMILFIFTTSFTSFTLSLSTSPWLLMLLPLVMKPLWLSSSLCNQCEVYSSQYTSLLLILLLILVMLSYVMKMLFSPFNPLKQLYE